MLQDEKSSSVTVSTNQGSARLRSFRISRKQSVNHSLNSSAASRFFRISREEKQPGNSLECYDRLERIYRDTSLGTRDGSHIPHNRKLLRNMLKRLESRGESFYRFGFRSYEKQSNLLVLQDLLNLRSEQVSGSMSLSDLWSSKNIVHYLKSNKMFLNKKQLMIELKLLEKEEQRLVREAQVLNTTHEMKWSGATREVAPAEASVQLQKSNMNLCRLLQKLSKLSAESVNMANKEASFEPLEEARKDFDRINRVYASRMIEIV